MRQCVGVAASVSVLSVSVFFEVVFFTPGRLATLHKHAGEEDWEKKRRVHDNKIMYGYTLKLFFKGPTECIIAWNNLRKSTAWIQDHIENDLHNKYLLDCSIPTADSARKLNCKKTKHCCNSCHMHEAKRKIGDFFFFFSMNDCCILCSHAHALCLQRAKKISWNQTLLPHRRRRGRWHFHSRQSRTAAEFSSYQSKQSISVICDNQRGD